ncbi:MAG: hypothetical protein GX216_09285 [Methanomicrobiales archaeon]|nr:hypothetical protein [Methanomicrobiales archaeon]
MRRDECAATTAVATLPPSSFASHWKHIAVAGTEPLTSPPVPAHAVDDGTIASRPRWNDALPERLRTTLFRDDEVIRGSGGDVHQGRGHCNTFRSFRFAHGHLWSCER